MRARYASALVFAAALGACEQTNQALPFDAQDVVTKVVPAGAASTVSTPAGASVQFPSNSMPSNTTVSLTQVSAPTTVQQSGAPISGGFKLEPAGLTLNAPAQAEVKFAPGARSDAWLATVINVAGGEAREIASTRVDLNAGLVQAGISQLGTLAVVIPEPGAVVRLGDASSVRSAMSPVTGALLATGTDSVGTRCGGVNNRCTGLAVGASQNLRDKVRDAAALYPQIAGKLRISAGRASGELRLHTTLRVLLRSGATAENVTVNARVRPTTGSVVSEDASRIRITNVHFSVSGSGAGESGSAERVMTLDIPKGASNGSTSITRTFQMRNAAGQLEDASVSVTFPLTFFQ